MEFLQNNEFLMILEHFEKMGQILAVIIGFFCTETFLDVLKFGTLFDKKKLLTN